MKKNDEWQCFFCNVRFNSVKLYHLHVKLQHQDEFKSLETALETELRNLKVIE